MENLLEKRFGRLTVTEYSHCRRISGKPRHYWKCTCDCGNQVNVLSLDLKRNRTTRCGTNCQIDFLNKLDEKFPNRDYIIKGRYKNRDTKILVECKYGEALVLPNSLILGSIPCITSAINKTKFFINQAKEIHGEEYDYSKVNYKNATTPIIIICKKHGEFSQVPFTHLCRSRGGHGCPTCRLSKIGNRTSGENRKGNPKKIK